MMVEHHNGAMQMAQTEQAQGLNPQATQLAGAIVADQQREISEMQALLSRVYRPGTGGRGRPSPPRLGAWAPVPGPGSIGRPRARARRRPLPREEAN